MCTPVRQDYLSDERFDDNEIGNDDRLLRHCRTPIQIVKCPINGYRLSSQAFRPGKGETHVSVDLECLLLKDGLEADARYGAMPNTFALAAVTAGAAREHAQGAAWTPKPEMVGLPGAAGDENIYHGEIIGPMTKRNYQDLAETIVLVRTDLNP
ncbi:hypothetical protein E5673_12905 [Sphingomonas sp. PAMC26645]|uniref:hypothetical protein n=1 Tax=Sphingomonas sp. PAMC26645 TaxID=2565555 RepID=UPI00109D88D2|nr:hypothetical protein [Sphingomonas sp. PAMC26645]QCB43006.1 hypothetical protein E5673_12905 [Sphingomonas sp. PAMC26645]